MNSIKFACTAMAGMNKVGNIKPDARGYYPMVVGALNMFNSAGMYYVYEEIKELFESSSSFMRRVKSGALRAEYGHPRCLPGMSHQDYVRRLNDILESNTCCTHRDIELDFKNYTGKDGKPIVAIISSVQPSGPLGSVLEKQLKNPDENVCFSVRSFTHDWLDNGIVKRAIKNLVTFDYVNEPGMSVATKYNSPALESLSEEVFTKGNLTTAFFNQTQGGVAMESSAILNATELFTSLGWKVPMTGSSSSRPKGIAKAGW